MKINIVGAFSIFLVILFVTGLGIYKIIKTSNKSLSKSNKIIVSTSFYPLYFFASQIGGDKADIKNITPASAEPHDYEPTAQEIARIENSPLVILNGGVEAWGDKVKDDVKNNKTVIITAGAKLLTENLTEEGKNFIDPHIWLSPQLAKQEIKIISEAFIQIDPKNRDYYEKNTRNLDAKMDVLDRNFRQKLANCKKHDIVTSHAAFGYLAKEYGLHQIAIAGLSPDQEPSSRKLAEVSDFVKKNKIKYVFFESLVSPKLSQTIAQETGAKTLVLDPLEGIPDNELIKGRDFISVMNSNLNNLQTALECSK